jgi:hypothetical protein
MLSIALQQLDWTGIGAQLAEANYALTPPLLSAEDCDAIAAMYVQDDRFRSTVTMARHGFGRGEYRYFRYPLPPPVQTLRDGIYPGLAAIANHWAKLAAPGDPAPRWPERLDQLLARCQAVGQSRPTPLMLRYGPGDFNCLHQDLYGELHFPFQAILLLDRPGVDFTGGELVLVENRPRQQSKVEVIPLERGGIAIIPVRERPRIAKRGHTTLRHGVSPLRSGFRRTLGLMFHAAA